MNNLYLKKKHLDILLNIFDNYCPMAEIWAYGSRANGKAHDGSDLDLTVINFNSDNKNLYELKELLTNSSLPFLVDINLFETLPDSFKKEIRENYVKIYPKLT